MGVETVRARGTPTVVNNGMVSNTPIASACSPNDVAVIQPRRERWAHEISNKLSANMASSAANLGCWYGHRQHGCQSRRTEKKKAAFSRGLLELFRHRRCRLPFIAWAWLV